MGAASSSSPTVLLSKPSPFSHYVRFTQHLYSFYRSILFWLTISLFILKSSSLPITATKEDHLAHVCGKAAATALLEYATFHNNMITGKAPNRTLISVPVEAGFADRLTGIISQFWLAFLSKHAFFIGQHRYLPSFEAAFHPAFINWSQPLYNVDNPQQTRYMAPLLFTYQGQRNFQGPRFYDPEEIDLQRYQMLYLINKDHLVKQYFMKYNLTSFPHISLGDSNRAGSGSTVGLDEHTQDESHVYTSSNRGGLRHLFNNTFHRAYLEEELGLSIENIFRCSYTFLFEINEAVQKLIESDLQVLAPASYFASSSALQYQVNLARNESSTARSRYDQIENIKQQSHKNKTAASNGDHALHRQHHHVSQSHHQQGVQASTAGGGSHTKSQHGVAARKLLDSGSDHRHRNATMTLMKIGIGIRVGDRSFHPDYDLNNTKWEQFASYFECAATLERSLQHHLGGKSEDGNKRTLLQEFEAKWYLMAESLTLRQQVSNTFNYQGVTTDIGTGMSANKATKKVITDTSTFYFHGDCHKRNYHGNCDQESLNTAIVTAVAQLTLFSMCDVHIISPISGFPRIAAILSSSPRIYRMVPLEEEEIHDYCQLGNHTSIEVLAKIGNGI